MPQPHTGELQDAGTPLWTFDSAGNLVLRGGLSTYGVAVPDTTRPGYKLVPSSSGVVPAGANVTDLLNVRAFGADPTGNADSTAAIQDAISTAPSGGIIFFPSGTYLVNQGPLTGLSSNLRLTGDTGATLKTTSAGLFSLGSAGTSSMEIDHLAMDVTGGDVFNGGHLSRCYFHDLVITQRSAGFGIWNAPNLTLFLENRWERITSTVTATARTVPAWNFVSAGNDLFNENKFEDFVCNNNGPDIAQYHFLVDCAAAADSYQNNKFCGITFENPLGGAVKILSGQQTTLERCRIWDLSANPSAHLFYIGTDGTSGVVSSGTAFRDCGRSFGPLSGTVADIHLDSGTAGTVIDNYYQLPSGGQQVYIDLGSGAVGTVLVNPPSNLTLQNTTAASYTKVGSTAPSSYADSSGNSYAMQATPAIWLPSDNGLIAAAWDPALIGSSGVALIAGTAIFTRLKVRVSQTISKVWFAVIAAATGVTAGENFFCLYSVSGGTATLLISGSADSVITSTGTQSVSVTSQAVAAGDYLAMVYCNASGMPSLGRQVPGGSYGNTGLSTSNFRFFGNSGATGLTTTPPASITLANNTTLSTDFWAALS